MVKSENLKNRRIKMNSDNRIVQQAKSINMASHQNTVATDKKALLSTLWIFVLLNIIFRDIHEFFRPGLLKEMMAGVVNGNKVTEEVMLIGAIMVEIPILMVLLSRILNYRINRWVNIIIGAITIALVIGMGQKDLDDLFFTTVEVIALSVIIWLAGKWRKYFEH
jgi:hypothetical protein